MIILGEKQVAVMGPPTDWVPEQYRVRSQRGKLSYALKYSYRFGLELVRVRNGAPLADSLWFVRARFGSLNEKGFCSLYVVDTKQFRFSQVPGGMYIAMTWCHLVRRGLYGQPLSAALLYELSEVEVHCNFNPPLSQKPIFEVWLGKIAVAGFLPEQLSLSEHCYARTMVDD